MSYKPNQNPSSDDASEFLSFIDSVLIKKNALLSGYFIDYDDEVREKVRLHKFYSWLISTAEFPRICPYLKKKGLTGKFPESIDIYMAKCAALVYIGYCRFSSHPDQLIRTTQATSEKTLKHIDALTNLFNADLQKNKESQGCANIARSHEDGKHCQIPGYRGR